MGAAGDSLGLEGWLQGLDASKLLIALLPVWILGAFIGMLLPRPRWLETSTRFGAYWLSSPSGVLLRRFALAIHGFVIAREVWRHCTIPGTFHAIAAAVWGLLQGKGFDLQLPADTPPHVNALIKDAKATSNDSNTQDVSVAAADWHITEADLQFFQHRVEQDVVIPGAGKWEHMTDLRLDSLTYTAWRRRLPDGKTEYKSTTVADDATAEEFMDFYLDDSSRHTWDTMISDYGVIESGPSNQRCQVVHWLRTFPFSFISQREYVIGRRVWKQNGALYGIMKSIKHPQAPQTSGIVRMDVFYSMWRSRTIPDPKDPSRPACETVLLHHEQFKIPENLSRFAVRHGMAGFVKKMAPAVKAFVTARRQRVDAFAADPEAYGVAHSATQTPRLAHTLSVISSIESETSESSSGSSEVSYPCRLSQRRPKKVKSDRPVRKVRSLVIPVLAAGAAIFVTRLNKAR
ncbi:hypothetical protein WJX79_003695 [Trebouxia sp. C0005]